MDRARLARTRDPGLAAAASVGGRGLAGFGQIVRAGGGWGGGERACADQGSGGDSDGGEYEDSFQFVSYAALVEIVGAGHMAPIERPEPVARALRRWLAAIG